MHLRLLHSLRGLAALYVVAAHARLLLWQLEGDASPLAGLVIHLFTFAHQAVLLFFLISGVCIHYRQAAARATDSATTPPAFDAWAFGRRRVRRLVPPLAAGLLVTAVCDGLGAQLNPTLYAPLGLSHSLPTLAGNLLMQASLSVPVFGTNVPLWSLSVEAWLYALYPIMLLGFARLGVRRALMVAMGVSVASHWLHQWAPWWPLDVLVYWATWVGGAAIAEAHARQLRPRLLRGLGPATVVALLVMAVVPLEPGLLSERFTDGLWGVALGLGLAYLLLDAPRWPALPGWAVAGLDRLGDISYSLYLVHFPWLGLLAAWWLATQGPIPSQPGLMLAGIVSSLGLAGLAWQAVERRCYRRPVAVGRVRLQQLAATS